MDIQLLRKAQNGLKLLDIQQIHVKAYVGKEYEPRLAPDSGEMAYQNKQGLAQPEIINVGSGDEEFHIFRATVDFGIRFVPKPENDGEIPKDTDVYGEIEAVYRIDYKIEGGDLLENEAALGEFARYNASHHAWPFWREFADSQMSKMRLPNIMMPMQVPAGTADED